MSVVETVKSAFDFQVQKFPLYGPDNLKTPCYGMFRSDTSEYVGTPNSTVSKKYVPHTTDDVVALAEAASHAFDNDVKTSCYFNNGHYVSIQPSNEHRLNVFNNRDNVWPRVTIRAGYDGKAFSAIMGFFRDLCRNMSMIRKVEGTCVSIRHSSGLRSKMDDLIDTFNVLKESWSGLSDIILHLQNTEVRMADFLNQVYGDAPAEDGRGKTIHVNRTKAIWDRLNSERFRSGRPVMQSDRVSAWEAFNAIQGYVQHDATRKRNASDFARIVAAHNDPKVKLAEKLVYDMVA